MNALAFTSSMINKKESLEMSPSSYTPPSFKGRFVSALLSRTSGIRRFLALAAVTALLGGVAQAQSIPISLTSWTSDAAAGTWVLQSADAEVKHTNNNNYSVFYSNEISAIENSFTAAVKVDAGAGDNDFFGFVLGYQPGDVTSASAKYILIDWKKGFQDDPAMPAECNAVSGTGGSEPGLAISLVTGAMTPAAAWCHKNEATELARANTLSSTGWVDGVTYTFRIDFTATRIRVYVSSDDGILDNSLELSVLGDFTDGRFGFYNTSQPDVVYGGVTRAAIVPQPIPVNQTTWMLIFGIGLFALYGIRRRSKKA